MLIAIPTMARVDRQVTLQNFLGTKLMPNVVLCPPAFEKGLYPKHLDKHIMYVPKQIRGIARTREWIIRKLTPKLGHKYVMMIDDDMDFCYRPNMAYPDLLTIKSDRQLRDMIALLQSWFDQGFVHVGVSARQGNNHIDEEYVDGGRMMNMFGYNVELLKKARVKFGRVEVMEDFDLTLQLLRKGLPNRVSYRYCWNQRGSGAEGGCSVYRNGAVQAKAAEKLANFHPDFVKTVVKTAKTYWKDLKTRTDVQIQWKKALAEGLERKAKGYV